MKRTFIIRNVILTILILAIIIGVSYYFITTNNKKYEIEKVEQYNYFLLKQDGKTGVIDRSGNIVIDVKYDDIKIPNPQKDVFVCYSGENSQILNSQKEQILNNYQDVEPIKLQNIASNLMFEKSVLSYKENDKYGLVNFQGKKITKPIYDEISGLSYKEGELLVKQNDKYGVINIKGHKLIDIEYDKIAVDGYYTNDDGYKYAGYIITTTIQEGYRYGYINYNGKLILKPEYNELSRITDIMDNENAYLLCAKNGQFGVNKNEKEIVKNEYQSISYDKTNELLVAEKSKKYGIASLDGKIIVPAQFLQNRCYRKLFIC
ncbi:MAG: WG repeat-containing protein [Clostridia bacterium]